LWIVTIAAFAEKEVVDPFARGDSIAQQTSDAAEWREVKESAGRIVDEGGGELIKRFCSGRVGF
jgi:hypothetical protein